MRWLFPLMFVLIVAAGPVLAQGAPPQSKPDQPKAEKSENDKKEDKNQAGSPESEFTDAVANTVLSDIRDGLEGHSQRLMLSAFDPDKMDGYLTFKDQIQAFFETYETFRVHYRIAQSTTEGARGIVLVDFELEETPRGANGPPQRKSSQIRFELERGTKGWKIVDLNPADFFS